ncbi:glycoside hydrolase family protein [Candidatus Aalborgicola defluviihabitans]|uniref:glycoside hydrolase family protein n=1 Tax=Candidatus Aalborgicola defluviihabitans TaxID=3386187 RepID=UPI0039B9877E
MSNQNRSLIASLALSAAGLVGIAVNEGYNGHAYPDPVLGTKVPTIGFGTTGGVHMGDTTTPVKALQRKLSDVQAFEGAIKQCVRVPLHQYEYDAFINPCLQHWPHGVLQFHAGQTAQCAGLPGRL